MKAVERRSHAVFLPQGMGAVLVLFSGVLLALFLWAGGARAEGTGFGPWTRTNEADVRLLSAVDTVAGQDRVRLGLEFKLKGDWKVYWRSAGDAGYPPTVDWQGSENLGPVTFAWPVPHRFELFGIQTAGYKKHVVFPLTAQVLDPTQPVALRGEADFLICSNICIPGRATLALDLPATGGAAGLQPTDAAHVIDQFQARVPAPGRGIALEQVVLSQPPTATAEGEIALQVSALTPLGPEVDLFVEGDLPGQGVGVISGKPQVVRQGDGKGATLRASLAAGFVPGTAVTITVADGDRGLEAQATPQAGTLSGAATASDHAAPAMLDVPFSVLLGMIGLAVAGGFILNLMPCVLPVLSLKVLALVGQGGQDRRHARQAFVASALGIIAAFLALGGVLIALRASGMAIGWGIQFQQPWFLMGMIAILVVFAANMWGFFEIRLPGAVNDVAGSAHGTGWWGHFLTGAFATVLATPCSAPLLGTAVGFALAADAPTILIMFAALGVGMALPYALVAAFPAVATRLPRPGRWMIVLKKILALALIGTALWLAAVLYGQISGPQQPADANDSGESVAWQDFRPSGTLPDPTIEQAVAAGHLVFVDVTADWCITCKVNKAAVLDRDPVRSALKQDPVRTLRADWTRPDAGIAAYLAAYGRYGIPFNVVYGPAAPQGIPLSELLTDQEVLDALKQAQGG